MELILTNNKINTIYNSNSYKALLFNIIRLFSITVALLLIPSLSAAQVSDVALLKKAISLRQTSNNQQAIEILTELKIQHNDHKRINIELAINYIKLNQYTQAKNILDYLYNLPLSPKELKKLQTLQKKLKSKATKKITSAHSYALEAIIYSGVDSVSSQFPIYEYSDGIDWQDGYEVDNLDEDLFVNRKGIIEKQTDNYSAQNIKAYYRYAPKKKFKLFGQNSFFIWSNNLSLYQQQKKSKNKYGQVKFDSNFSLLQSNKWFFDLRLRMRSHFSDNDKILDDQGIQVSISYPINNNRLKVGLELRKKSFNELNQQNDATISTPWLEYTVKLAKQFKLSFGSQYRQKNAFDVFNSYKNINIYSRLNYIATSNFNAYLSLNYNQLHYKIDDPQLVAWSDEVRKSINFGSKYQLNKHFNIGLNSYLINNQADKDNGENEWFRVEAFIGYRF
jgi:hypothetical protein